MAKVITRFAPSPTGYLHAGNYRTALFCYIFAKQNHGDFLLRIEDTDKSRSKKEFEENIIESLEWLGIFDAKKDADKIFRQSDRTVFYTKILKQLVESGKAYVSDLPEDKADGKEIIRLKNPNKQVSFDDMIRGKITFDTTEHGDFVIAKSFTSPVFHLAVVADDFDMGITHIIRGEDHISNTARHILLQEAMGAPTPIYAHLPLVLSSDRTKLSKRKGALALTEYRDKGFLPQAMINFLVMIGWNPGDNRELLSMSDLLDTEKGFKIEKIQKGGGVFNEQKLLWLNKEYIKTLSNKEFTDIYKEFIKKEKVAEQRIRKNSDSSDSAVSEKLLPAIKSKVSTLGEVAGLLSEMSYIETLPEYNIQDLLWKDEKEASKAREHLMMVRAILQSLLPELFTEQSTKEAIWAYAENYGKGNVLWPLRYALSGVAKSPDPFTLLSILGKDQSLERISKAISMLEDMEHEASHRDEESHNLKNVHQK